MKKKINFVVIDLDDTIWDWLQMWYSSFYPYFSRISNEFNIDQKLLKQDFKRLHEKYETSEASFIYHELETLSDSDKQMMDVRRDNQKSILHEYYSNKKKSLTLFDGVRETLINLKNNGVLVVGFTESSAYFTKYRLKHLSLDGLIDCIYTPIGFDLPESVQVHYPEKFWEPEYTKIRYLTKSIRKPAPEILEIIFKDFNANKVNSIYIGDKLDKDIDMANKASVHSVYAKYGHRIEGERYNLLREVTHWSDDAVSREIAFKKNSANNIIADYVLEESFSEINKWFTFFPFPLKSEDKINLDAIIELWKKAIEVQQHFNDIALRIKNIALTLFTFIIGGIGFLLRYEILFWETFPAAALLAFFGLIIMGAFFYIDKYWYHRLLLGAVKQAIFIEEKWRHILPEIGLASRIKEESSHSFFWIKRFRVSSRYKFWIFYALLTIPLLVIMILILIKHNIG